MRKNDSNVLPDTIGDKIRKSVSSRNYELADYQYQRIMESIYDFEQYLDKDKEVALYLTNFGESVLMHITDIGYSNPSLIHYFGYVNGNYAELIQHVSQINFLITSAPKLDDEKPARRIGFKNNVGEEFVEPSKEDLEDYEALMKESRTNF